MRVGVRVARLQSEVRVLRKPENAYRDVTKRRNNLPETNEAEDCGNYVKQQEKTRVVSKKEKLGGIGGLTEGEYDVMR
jgi:hypothetical protein